MPVSARPGFRWAILSVLLLTFLLGCGSQNPTPTATTLPRAATGTPVTVPTGTSLPAPTSSQAPTTPATTAATTNLKSGRLDEVFPALAKLSDQTKSLKIWYGQSDMIADQSAYYSLQRNQNGFKGQMLYRIDSWAYLWRQTAAEIEIPFSAVDSFLKILGGVQVEEGIYEPKIDHTDDYPSLEFQLETGAGQLRFFSNSQGTERVPWGLLFTGRMFTINSAIPATAYEKLDPYLGKEAQDRTAAELWEALKAKPTSTPVSSVPPGTTASAKESPNLKEKYFIPAQAVKAGENIKVALSQDAKLFATTGQEGVVKVWETATGKELLNITTGEGHPSAVVFSPDGRLLGIGYYSGTIKLFEVEHGKEVSFNKPPHPQSQFVGPDVVDSLAFSPDGKTLASGGGIVSLWEVGTGRKIATLDYSTDYYRSLSFSPDGKTLFNSYVTFYAWDVSSFRNLLQSGDFELPGLSLESIALSPDGKVLVQEDKLAATFELWDVGSRTKLATLPDPERTGFRTAFSRDGKLLVTSSGVVTKLWDIPNRREISRFVDPSVTTFALSPDGKYLLTGYRDGSVRLWEVTV